MEVIGESRNQQQPDAVVPRQLLEDQNVGGIGRVCTDPELPASNVEPVSGGSVTLLLTDVDPMVRKVYGWILNRTGYKVLLTGNGFNAVKLFGPIGKKFLGQFLILSCPTGSVERSATEFVMLLRKALSVRAAIQPLRSEKDFWMTIGNSSGSRLGLMFCGKQLEKNSTTQQMMCRLRERRPLPYRRVIRDQPD